MLDTQTLGTKKAWALCAGLIGTAFVAASLTSQSGFLSLSPPPTPTNLNPEPDVSRENAVVLYQAAYTAWVALVLTIPAMAKVWTRKRSMADWYIWRLFWTIGFAAFLVHMIWSMGVFFGGDIGWMTTSSRVSAFWPGIIFLFWWGTDVVLAWRCADTGLITIQRGLLHGVAFILFVGGSLVTGETLPVKLLGAVFILATLYGAFRRGAVKAPAITPEP